MTVINWRLKAVMKDLGLKASHMAEVMDVRPNTVSNWWKAEMPEIGGARLNQILHYLNSNRGDRDLIEPSDLIEYTLTATEAKNLMGGGNEKTK